MPVRDDFKPGQFCWVDLNTHDLKAASAWYGELFGWTPAAQDTSGGPPYQFFLKGETPAAAGGQMSDEMKAQGIPPMWNSYVLVEDCEATEKIAASLGATITVPTMEVPGHGKLCYFLDPGGASLALWQATGPSKGLHVAEPGGLAWNELMTRDLGRSREFFSTLFGWTFRDMPMEGIPYTMIEAGGADAGGMMPMDGPMWEGVPEHWMVYFAVADCDAAATKVAASGGKICVPPTAIPVGKFSVLSDPQGATFSIIQMNEASC